MVGLQLFLSWNSHTKGCLSCFIWDLNADTDPKGRFVSFKFTPSNGRVLCVYVPQGIAPGNSWTGGRFFGGLQNYRENKDKGNENKILLEDFNCTMVKWTGMVKIKPKDLIGTAPVMPCQNSSWMTSLRIYGEERTQIPLSSPATIGPLARIQDRQGLYWYKNC